jgi:hypothetical protein
MSARPNVLAPELNAPAVLLADQAGDFSGNDFSLGGGTIQSFLGSSTSANQPYQVFTDIKYTIVAAVPQNPAAVLQVWTNQANAYGGSIQFDPFSSIVGAGFNLTALWGPGAFLQSPNSVNYNGYGGQFSNIQIGVNGSSTNLPGYFSGVSGIAGGSAFTLGGCYMGGSGNKTGEGDTGTYVAGGGPSPCTTTITINGSTGLTAPNGWNCSAFDATNSSVLINQIPNQGTSPPPATTTVTLSGTPASGDVIHFTCRGY